MCYQSVSMCVPLRGEVISKGCVVMRKHVWYFWTLLGSSFGRAFAGNPSSTVELLLLNGEILTRCWQSVVCAMSPSMYVYHCGGRLSKGCMVRREHVWHFWTLLGGCFGRVRGRSRFYRWKAILKVASTWRQRFSVFSALAANIFVNVFQEIEVPRLGRKIVQGVCIC
jgi:hypothetical protein